MNWPLVELGEVCEFKYGKSLPASQRDGGSNPVYGSNGVVGYHSEAISQGPAIVIGRKGSYGEVAYSPESCWPIDTTYFVDSTATKAHLKWLHYRLSALGLNQLNRAAAIPGLNREDAYRLRLLLPPHAEQRRIAAVLEHADSLCSKRRRVLSDLDAFAHSSFLDMFGKFSGAFLTVEEVAAPDKGTVRTGPFGSQLRHGEFVDDGIAVLGLDNVVGNQFSWGKRRYITAAKYQSLRRYTVHPGDVLVSIMGTCGRCVVVPADIGTAINTKHICAITLDRNVALPEFVRAAFLWHPRSRQHLKQRTKGSIMDGLNMGIIKEMPLPVPPLDDQREFVEMARKVDTLLDSCLQSATELEELFASLQSRAFSGQL